MVSIVARTTLLCATLFAAVGLLSQKSHSAPAQAAALRVNATMHGDCTRFRPYSDDAQHIWNRVHRRFMERRGHDGNIWGCDDVDPLLWTSTDHLLRGDPYREAVSLLDEFIGTHAEQLIRDPIPRAIFQHDLWAVFDWLAGPLTGHEEERRQLERGLAAVIKAVALTRTEIECLPDNYKTLSGSTTADGFVLPDNTPGWTLIARDDGMPIAPIHSFSFPRSLFFVYLRLPSGEPQTDTYLEAMRAYSRRHPEGSCLQPDVPCDAPQFPVGTELALLRRALLVDTSGRPVVSPITESVQLRRYREIPSQYTIDWRGVMQRAAEFQLTRRALRQGEITLRRVGEDEYQFPVFQTHGFDFEGPGVALRSCRSCHQGIGVFSFTSYSRMQFENKTFIMVHAATELEQSSVAIAYLEGRASWKRLQQFLH